MSGHRELSQTTQVHVWMNEEFKINKEFEVEFVVSGLIDGAAPSPNVRSVRCNVIS